MSIFFELRYPTRWYTKLLIAVLALFFFAVIATSAVAAFLVYRIVKPQRTSSEINMQSFPGRPDSVSFTVRGIGDRQGWFFPGLRGGPTILLCHGYESSRGELLTLVSALQDQQYNVFVFDFAAHGGNGGLTTFGYREADEILAAINTLAARDDVDRGRFGLWGYNMGAYAALRAAEEDRRVRALVLDSVYDSPSEMVKVAVERTGLGGFPFMVKAAKFSFEGLNYAHRGDPPLSSRLSSIAGVPVMFMQAGDEAELGDITRQMYMKASEPREQAFIQHGNYARFNEDDKRVYENRVVTFFILKLPPSGKVRH